MMDKEALPRYSAVDPRSSRRYRRRNCIRILKLIFLAGLGYVILTHWAQQGPHASHTTREHAALSIDNLKADYAICSKLRSLPEDPRGLRQRNARYVEGHPPMLIRNATVWTGEAETGTSIEDARHGKGYAWIQADVFIEHGLIKRVEPDIPDADLPDHCLMYNAKGRQLTSGIVDMHSHAGVDPLPELRGSSDDNELSSDITPYVRSIDGLNPLDHQIQVIKSGGVTTSLILPGSGNNMGGEAFVIKHSVGKADGRLEISAEDMLADPDKTWRYMKMACGENPKAVYGRVGRDFGPFSRLGEAWYFRHAFEQASALVKAQDDWCDTADRLGPQNMATYLPQELKWESLGALLRGQVLLNTHCYTIPDLEAFVKHTNEFRFAVRAFHHAHQTYLVPEILKRAYGGRPPAAALFADTMYYKAEAYVASEQAGKILWDNGITPVYVSDNPVINAQHVVFEAAKAYRNGLPYHVALAGVTSAPAELLGLGERVGKVKPGFDADIVVWDSDPLSIGATPVEVWIDGDIQYNEPIELKKPATPPLKPGVDLQLIRDTVVKTEDIVLYGVKKVMIRGLEQLAQDETGLSVIIRNSTISCIGSCNKEIATAQANNAMEIHLNNGYLAPALTVFGSGLGLVEIEAEGDTQDGFNNDAAFSRAVDGLTLNTKQLEAAFSHGVTKAISPPLFLFGGAKGVSVGFSTGALHSQEHGAVWQEDVALHYTLTKSNKSPSLSNVIGGLRSQLLKAIDSNTTDHIGSTEEAYLKKVVEGQMALVINTHSADNIASLLRLKAEVESASSQTSNSTKLRLVILGAAESYLLAAELAAANVGVVLAPMLSYAATWDQRRALTGAPLTNGTAIDILHAAGVKVAIGSVTEQVRNLFLDAGIARVNGGGKIREEDALAFVSSNIYDMLGLKESSERSRREFVVFEGSPLEIDGRVRAVADGRGKVKVWT